MDAVFHNLDYTRRPRATILALDLTTARGLRGQYARHVKIALY